MTNKKQNLLEKLFEKTKTPILIVGLMLLGLFLAFPEVLWIEVTFQMFYLVWIGWQLAIIGFQVARGEISRMEIAWAIGTAFFALALLLFLAF
jgi:hypothetical protein